MRIAVAGEPGIKRWTIAGPPPRSPPVHPAQLYSLIDALLLCFLLLAYEPYKRRDGELTALVLTLHPISRFLLEIIRVDESAVFGTGMSISQNISIAHLYGRTRVVGVPALAKAAGHRLAAAMAYLAA